MRQDHQIGRRIAWFRAQAGLSQAQLGSEIGHNQCTVSKLENGRLAPTPNALAAVAEALRVSVEEIIGLETDAGADKPSAEHGLRQAIPEIRAALDGTGQPSGRPTAVLAQEVSTAQIARVGCDYTALGDALPQLLTDTRVEPSTNDLALAELHVRVCVTTSIAVRSLGYLDLAVRSAERAQHIATAAGDPVMMAAADYAVAQTSLAAGLPGQCRRSRNVALEAANRLQSPQHDDAFVWYGMCHLQAALSAATEGDRADAQAHLQEAANAGNRNPADSWVQDFGPANVSAWRLAVALESHDLAAALAAVKAADRAGLRSRQLRARLLGDAARAYHAAERVDEAITSLIRALETSAPEVQGRAVLETLVAGLARSGCRDSRLPELIRLMGIDPLGVKGASAALARQRHAYRPRGRR